MLGNASLAALAVFTPNRFPSHTSHTEILVIEFPEAQQLVNDSFLLVTAPSLWDKAGIRTQTKCIEV